MERLREPDRQTRLARNDPDQWGRGFYRAMRHGSIKTQNFIDEAQIVSQRRGFGAWVLGEIIDPPQTNGFRRIGQSMKGFGLRQVHRAALEREAADGIRREGAKIARINHAQVALGGNVQPHRLDNLWTVQTEAPY